jgi:hypothetical protein
MSKEGIPAVYAVSDKAITTIDRPRHIAKTAQDKLPVIERPRVLAANARRNAMKENS